MAILNTAESYYPGLGDFIHFFGSELDGLLSSGTLADPLGMVSQVPKILESLLALTSNIPEDLQFLLQAEQIEASLSLMIDDALAGNYTGYFFCHLIICH